MAIVVEDGTGLANSTSYASVADFKDYHDCRGNDYALLGAGDPEIEQALVRATDYIDKRFGVRFKGIKGSADQALEWPRTGATDNNGYTLSGLPARLLKACYEYAFKAITTMPLAPDPSTNPGGETVSGEVTRKTEKVGDLEETTQYAHGTQTSVQQVQAGLRKVTSNVVSEASLPEYPVADLYLEPLLRVVDNRPGGFSDDMTPGTFTGEVRDPRFFRNEFSNTGRSSTRNQNG